MERIQAKNRQALLTSKLFTPDIEAECTAEYDGTHDPGKHINEFVTWMNYSQIHFVHWPRKFRLTLQEKALVWFEGLTAYQKSFWNILADQFMDYFTWIDPPPTLMPERTSSGFPLRFMNWEHSKSLFPTSVE